jgi:hypothetical protein
VIKCEKFPMCPPVLKIRLARVGYAIIEYSYERNEFKNFILITYSIPTCWLVCDKARPLPQARMLSI